MPVTMDQLGRPISREHKIVRVMIYDPAGVLEHTFHYNMADPNKAARARWSIVEAMLDGKIVVSGIADQMDEFFSDEEGGV